MRKNLSSGLAMLVADLLFLPSIVFAQDMTSAVDSNNRFALELYSKYKTSTGNIFLSPYSISSALAIAYEGARGKTADEIRLVFHFPKDDALRRESFLKMGQRINKKDKSYKLSTANALWAQKDYRFLEDYFKLISRYYGGNATNLNFAKEAEASRIVINNWVEKETNNKIKDLVPAPLNPMTQLIITNAVYFKGSWLKRFDKRDTIEADFGIGSGSKIKTQMMNLGGKRAEFNYAETDKLQILELPYEGNNLSMLILLPKADDLGSIEDSLTAEQLNVWKGNLRQEKLEISLPRFKFETKYFLEKELKDMGMPTAFIFHEADFSGMTGKRDLFISQIIHQVFIDVNEEGTEAAAATVVDMMEGSAVLEQVKIFKADHPFLFIIQEQETGNILFIGRVSDPA